MMPSWIWWLIGGIAGFCVFFYFLNVVLASYIIFVKTLKRTSREKWGRGPSSDAPELMEMDRIGMAWQADHEAYRKDVHIVNEGLNLYGEYYDLGYDKVAMILSGRTESLRYGYYFAKPYVESGYNILVVDPRAHGNSDGTYNTLGFDEHRDDLAWCRYLNKTFGIEHIVLHGVCIGAAGGLYTATAADCPACVKGLVTEGMFIYFGESMRNNLTQRKKLLPPILQCIDFWLRKNTGHSMMYGPIHVIDKMEKPILMIQGKEDRQSKPENAQKLFEKCGSREKQLVLLDIGGHSRLRINQTEQYDAAVKAFLKRLTPTGPQPAAKT